MLELISFVGIDSKTNIDDLIKLQDNSGYPLEFGVLYSINKSGKHKRYPAYDECLKIFDKMYHHDLISSLHLCGSESIDGFFSDNEDIMRLVKKNFGRIQLNLNVNNYDEDELVDKILQKCELNDIIIQHNKSKTSLIDKLITYDNNRTCREAISILYDASGGYNKELTDILPVFKTHFTGYAGGINPSNVKQINDKIHNLNKLESYYIDMESGIRTDDWFDPELCRQVIKNVEIEW